MAKISNHPQHIMLIDDDDDDVHLFRIMASEFFPEVTISVASNGEEALEKLKKPGVQRPELIFLDINMPKMDGFECLGELKKDFVLSTIPVIIYSTSSIEKQVTKAYEMGAHLYVVKAFDLVSYEDMLRKVLTRNWKEAPAKADFFIGDTTNIHWH